MCDHSEASEIGVMVNKIMISETIMISCEYLHKRMMIHTTFIPFVIAAAKKSSILDPPAHNRDSLLGPPSVPIVLLELPPTLLSTKLEGVTLFSRLFL